MSSVRRRFFTLYATAWLLAADIFAVGAGKLVAADTTSSPMTTQRVYVGTYTTKGSRGIYQFEFNSATGKAGKPKLAIAVANPPFLTLHPSGKFLYSVGQLDVPDAKKGERPGAVNAFAINFNSGTLTLLNQEASKGVGPCYVSLDLPGKNALVANYPSGDYAVLPIDAEGKLHPATAYEKYSGHGTNLKRQEAPHAHSIQVDPSGKFVLVADLGTDKIHVYRLNAEAGTLKPNDPPAAKLPAGSGPRHLAFHPNGKFAYVINELLSTITGFEWNLATGVLDEIENISTLPDGVEVLDNTTAEVLVHPSGKFLYGSNRGHDSIAMFSIDGSNGKLTPLGHIASGGKTPRNFRIDPTGQWLLVANQNSNDIHVFRIDEKTGKLTATGEVVKVPTPVCLKFYPPQ